MTCIVGIVADGIVYFGADSASVGPGWSLRSLADPKIVRNGQFLIGFTSSWRMGQLLAFAFTPPPPRDGADLFGYMVTDFIDAVRVALKDGGYAEKVNEHESGGEFLVAVRGRLFRILSDYHVEESRESYSACGSGVDIALGALFASEAIRSQSPIQRITTALLAAEQFSAGVRAPFHFETLAR